MAKNVFLSQGLLQINHVNKLNACLKNGMVVVSGKKIFYNMMPLESAFFVKGNGEGTVAGSHLQDGKTVAVNHVFLLVSKKEEEEELFFVSGDLAYVHFCSLIQQFALVVTDDFGFIKQSFFS